MVFSVAPKKYNIGSMKIRHNAPKRIPVMIFSTTALPKIFSAVS